MNVAIFCDVCVIDYKIIDLFEYAKTLGDKLIIGLTGECIFDVNERIKTFKYLNIIDEVCIVSNKRDFIVDKRLGF